MDVVARRRRHEHLPMSFRLFVYYCCLAGAASALAGWALGRALPHGEHLVAQGVKGLFLGLALALGLALVDALWNLSVRRVFSILARLVTAVLLGGMAGLLGGLVGEALFSLSPHELLRLPGYVLVGLLIGLSIGVFDLLASLLTGRDPRGALRKIRSGLVGGTLGGVLGGVVSMLLHSGWSGLFADKDPKLLWSPSATAFAALGACIGLLIGLAQVILKEAWVRVEEGFRPGRQQILGKEETTIGRAESCDVGLFGDALVEKLHARIRRQDGEFVLDDAGSAAGTYVNGVRVTAPLVLRGGDLIRVGRCLLSFGERRKKGQ
jgi:hypothetical protein